MKHSDSATLQRLTAHGISRIFLAVFLLCFAYSSRSLAQSASQKAPTITFHFSGDTTNGMLLSPGKSEKPLDDTDHCCPDIQATLVAIPNPCFHTTKGKSETPLNNGADCCCGLFSVWDACTSPICKVTVNFGNALPYPICCDVLPDGWTLTQGEVRPVKHNSLSNTPERLAQIAAVQFGQPPLTFQSVVLTHQFRSIIM